MFSVFLLPICSLFLYFHGSCVMLAILGHNDITRDIVCAVPKAFDRRKHFWQISNISDNSNVLLLSPKNKRIRALFLTRCIPVMSKLIWNSMKTQWKIHHRSRRYKKVWSQSFRIQCDYMIQLCCIMADAWLGYSVIKMTSMIALVVVLTWKLQLCRNQVDGLKD